MSKNSLRMNRPANQASCSAKMAMDLIKRHYQTRALGRFVAKMIIFRLMARVFSGAFRRAFGYLNQLQWNVTLVGMPRRGNLWDGGRHQKLLHQNVDLPVEGPDLPPVEVFIGEGHCPAAPSPLISLQAAWPRLAPGR